MSQQDLDHARFMYKKAVDEWVMLSAMKRLWLPLIIR
jgi:hypothetical protein